MKSETINDLTAALSTAQVSFKPIKRTEKVGYDTKSGSKKYNYAPLDVVIDATKEALSENGLAVIQSTFLRDGGTILETLLSHKSGQWLSGELYIGKQDLPPQTLGSALTYMRRYGLSAILGVSSEEDDDGQQAKNEKSASKTRISSLKPEQATPSTPETQEKTGIEKEVGSDAPEIGGDAVTAVTDEDIWHLRAEMHNARWDTPRLQKYVKDKGWTAKSLKQLTVAQLEEAVRDIIADGVKEE